MNTNIFEILPHRYPFMLLDKLLKCIPGESGLAIKRVSCNEPYFTGHFPNEPIVPGVLIVESCAQLIGLICADTTSNTKYHQYLTVIKNFTFKQPVMPGDTMYIQARVTEQAHQFVQGKTQVKTKRGIVASGIIIITDKK